MRHSLQSKQPELAVFAVGTIAVGTDESGLESVGWGAPQLDGLNDVPKNAHTGYKRRCTGR